MTSKEEIQKFIDNIKPYVPVRRYNIDIAKTVDMLERAVKDLEVLEILKKHLHIRTGTWSDIITCNIDSLTNENYEILEEWLKDE